MEWVPSRAPIIKVWAYVVGDAATSGLFVAESKFRSEKAKATALIEAKDLAFRGLGLGFRVLGV